MNKLYIIVAVLITVAFITVRCNKTPVEQCPGQHFEGLTDRVHVLPCGKSRCNLRKKTNTTVVFKFKPAKIINQLTNNVFAVIAGIPLPFAGVSGVSACPQVKHAATGKPAPCPLAASQEYVYTNHFPIESYYPSVPLRVHWSLNDGAEDILCFEVPAVIT